VAIVARATADQGGQHPAIPIHGRTPSLGGPQKIDRSDHRVVGEEREVHFRADHVDDGVGDDEDDREYGKLARRHHEPNPRVLLAIWPTLALGPWPRSRVCLGNDMDQISQGKQGETKNGTTEVEVMTKTMLIAQCIQGNRCGAAET
jgi:hypothetical protein